MFDFLPQLASRANFVILLLSAGRAVYLELEMGFVRVGRLNQTVSLKSVKQKHWTGRGEKVP